MKKLVEVEKAIKYFDKLEEYAQKEGDTFIAQFSIRERIEIYKRLGDKEKYNELLQEFYNKDQEILDINDKQYDFHLNKENFRTKQYRRYEKNSSIIYTY